MSDTVSSSARRAVARSNASRPTIGEQFKATMSVGQVALALDNEAACAAIAQLMPHELKLAIASVMLQSAGRAVLHAEGRARRGRGRACADGVGEATPRAPAVRRGGEWSLTAERIASARSGS
jgi:hypothetical protein